MGRKKTKRELSFKPHFRDFAPLNGANSKINLHHEEIEAIYLIDYKGMYQADAAKLMGISRPTLSRIIKNARLKVSTMLISAKQLHIEDDKTAYNIACICDDPKTLGELGIDKKYVVIISIENDQIIKIEKTDNPLLQNKAKPAMIMPNLLAQKNVDYFLLDKIGEGFKNSLIAHAITPVVTLHVTMKSLLSLKF